MSDAEGEIEYLDEDEEIVQQFVNKATTQNSDDEHFQSVEDAQDTALSIASLDILNRRKLGITLPDFSDPLCMPVNAYRTSEIDVRRITNWNNLCLDRLKCTDQVLKLDEGFTKSSKRTVILKKIKHRPFSNEAEISMWNKTTVENDKGAKKSEIFQCTLPKYREEKLLDFKMKYGYRKKFIPLGEDTVLLCKEGHDKEERLVAYNTKQGTVALYKLEEIDDGSSIRKHAREVTCTKVCAPCYQVSHRGSTAQNIDKEITCPICKRSWAGANNLINHLKNHSNKDIRKNKNAISRVLASVLPYHYKCRICQEQFLNVKALRKHVARHKSNELFMCEVGNHIAS